MEIIEKQTIKEVPVDGNYGYGYGRKDINGKANAGLTLGIIGTALGAWALSGNRRSFVIGGLGTSGSGMLDGANININGLSTAGNGITSPSAFQAWEKGCEDTLALQKGLYDWALVQQSQRFADRQTIDSELFGLYKSQVDADFGLYKSTRDGFDALSAKHNADAFSLYKSQRDSDDAIMKELSDLKAQVAINAAIRPLLMEYLRSKGISEQEFMHKFKEFMSGHTRNNHSSNDDYHLMYGSAYDSNRHHDISSSFNPERSRGGLFERFNRMSDSLTEEDMYEIMKMAREKKNSGNEHFNESYAKYLVSNMYHYEGGRKYVGEKFSMAKAKEVCERYRGVIPQSFTHADVYVAINEHYHNCSELFKSWFGEDIDQKVIEAAILFWFKDDDCKSNSKLWNHFKEN